MKRLKPEFLAVAFGLFIILLFPGCVPNGNEKWQYEDEDWQDDEFDESDTQSFNYNYLRRSYPLQKAEMLNVYFQFSNGDFRLKKSKNNLAGLYLKYREGVWRPEIFYNDDADTITLKVKLKRNKDIRFEKTHNIFAVALTDHIPVDLNLAFGAGEGDFILDGIKVRHADFALGAGNFNISLKDVELEDLDFSAGVGSAVVDFSGPWHNDLNADFACGMGDLKIILPEKTGVKVEISGFLGNIDAIGLKKKERGVYVNKAYGKSKYNLNLEVAGALGNISMEVR